MNQSLVMHKDGINPVEQQYSKQPLLNTEMALTPAEHGMSGYGEGKIVPLCKNTKLTPLTTPLWTPKTYPPSILALIFPSYLNPAGSLSR